MANRQELPQAQWEDCTVTYAGQTIYGIVSFSLSEERNRDPYFGAGSTPRGNLKGRKTFNVSITLLQSSFEDLMILAGPGKTLTDLTFDITIVYATEVPSVHQISGFAPTGYSFEMSSDGGVAEVPISGQARAIDVLVG